jgi:hypothetical protein
VVEVWKEEEAAGYDGCASWPISSGDSLTECNNVTLERCYPWSSHDERVGYYLALNKFGRGIARTGH